MDRDETNSDMRRLRETVRGQDEAGEVPQSAVQVESMEQTESEGESREPMSDKNECCCEPCQPTSFAVTITGVGERPVKFDVSDIDLRSPQVVWEALVDELEKRGVVKREN